MPSPEDRLAELDVVLPEPPAPAAAYQAWARSGDLLLTAGQLPLVDGRLPAAGKVGVDVDRERAAQLARTAAVNLLAVAKAATGDLGIVRLVKLTVFVASARDFTEQHLVANGASEFLADVLGDRGVHARSAVGVPALPLDSPVEIEAIFQVAGDR